MNCFVCRKPLRRRTDARTDYPGTLLACTCLEHCEDCHRDYYRPASGTPVRRSPLRRGRTVEHVPSQSAWGPTTIHRLACGHVLVTYHAITSLTLTRHHCHRRVA